MMAERTIEQQLTAARAEVQALSDQLCQARADLRRLGIADQNRALAWGAISGLLGLATGIGVGLHLARK